MSRPRIAIAALMHESNGFAPGATTLADFEVGGLDKGMAVARRWAEAHHEIGGFFEAANTFDFELIPTFTAWAMPSGMISRETYDHLLDRLLASIRSSGKCDGLLLALHGAMLVEGINDSADACTAQRVRELLGPDLPMVVTLDFHANVSSKLAESADAVVVYQTNPHVDQKQRGLRAGEIIRRAIDTGKKPVTSIKPMPVLMNIMTQNTSKNPSRLILDEASRIRSQTEGLLEIQFVAGFPYADSESTGVSIVAVAESKAVADSAAQTLAAFVWSIREKLSAQPPEAAQAVRQATSASVWPTVLVDVGDNIGGGSAADSTLIAHEIIRQEGPEFWVVLHDPAAVEACIEAGAGNNVHVEIGGHVDSNAPPLTVSGTVKLVHDGKYEEPQARHGGVRFHDQGLTAVVQTDRGDIIICNSHRHAPFSLGQLTSLGLDPTRARIIIVKAAVAFRAAYEPIAASIIEVDTPGLTAANPRRFHYTKVRRPILPLDEEVSML
jgi:microcystin degradation protein MlrC